MRRITGGGLPCTDSGASRPTGNERFGTEGGTPPPVWIRTPRMNKGLIQAGAAAQQRSPLTTQTFLGHFPVGSAVQENCSRAAAQVSLACLSALSANWRTQGFSLAWSSTTNPVYMQPRIMLPFLGLEVAVVDLWWQLLRASQKRYSLSCLSPMSGLSSGVKELISTTGSTATSSDKDKRG